MIEPRCVWDAGAILGEGPVWVEGEGALYWVDIKAPAVHRYVPGADSRTSWPVDRTIGCIAPRMSGGFVATCDKGFANVDLEAGRLHPLVDPEADRSSNRFNDGKCDSHGRLWAGSMDDREREPTGALYRFDPDGSWSREDDGYVITNGPAFSPDGRLLYHTDTLARLIFVFDLGADGRPTNKRPFLRISDDAGYPDGMTVDAEGGLWVAHYGGWRVTRFTPGGRLDRTIRLPAHAVTSCAFGGPDLRTLYVTTAAKGLTPEERRDQPLAGGLFAVEVDIPGLPTCRFGHTP